MNEDSKKIIDFKNNYLKENYQKYKEICNNFYYRKMIRNKFFWPANVLYDEAYDIITALEKNEIPDSCREFAQVLAIVSLAAIKENKLDDTKKLVRKK